MGDGVNVGRRLCRIRIGIRVSSRAGNFHYIGTTRPHDRIAWVELNLEKFVPTDLTMTRASRAFEIESTPQREG